LVDQRKPDPVRFTRFIRFTPDLSKPPAVTISLGDSFSSATLFLLPRSTRAGRRDERLRPDEQQASLGLRVLGVSEPLLACLDQEFNGGGALLEGVLFLLPLLADLVKEGFALLGEGFLFRRHFATARISL
jgi:hypothetical protein